MFREDNEETREENPIGKTHAAPEVQGLKTPFHMQGSSRSGLEPWSEEVKGRQNPLSQLAALGIHSS